MAGNRLYTTNEIKALLERATELQKKQPGSAKEGLTLEELEQIASDSGIDPEYIRQAISEQKTSPASGTKFHILGGPISQEAGKEIPYTMSAANWEMIVQEARRTFRKSGGDLQELGNSLEWVSPDQKFMQVSVSATPSETNTRLFVSTSYGKIAFMAYYFGFVITLISLGIYLGHSELPTITNISILLAGALTTFGGVRFLFGRWVKSQKKKLKKMLNRFERIISTHQKPDPESMKEQSPGIEIDEKEQESNTVTTRGKGKVQS